LIRDFIGRRFMLSHSPEIRSCPAASSTATQLGRSRTHCHNRRKLLGEGE
jgi:hypothetical protein